MKIAFGIKSYKLIISGGERH